MGVEVVVVKSRVAIQSLKREEARSISLNTTAVMVKKETKDTKDITITRKGNTGIIQKRHTRRSLKMKVDPRRSTTKRKVTTESTLKERKAKKDQSTTKVVNTTKATALKANTTSIKTTNSRRSKSFMMNITKVVNMRNMADTTRTTTLKRADIRKVVIRKAAIMKDITVRKITTRKETITMKIRVIRKQEDMMFTTITTTNILRKLPKLAARNGDIKRRQEVEAEVVEVDTNTAAVAAEVEVDIMAPTLNFMELSLEPEYPPWHNQSTTWQMLRTMPKLLLLPMLIAPFKFPLKKRSMSLTTLIFQSVPSLLELC